MSTKRRFRDRVAVEREVLHLVNRPLFGPTELCGLTANAIGSWARAVAKSGLSQRVVDDLEQALLEISGRCRLNADKSRDVFEDGELVPRGTVESCVAELHQQIEALEAGCKFKGRV
ncbi:hypothetical protein BPS26883_04756 [Burkholderia pseudomultivorans]|uniref:Uncharacterized protein n=1 Tax=Burkholderia pseudomultivorans TaxID=1207504 RepID=A0A6P2NTM8_9BURK|nr:hypothetical protein BPS26883_04756 [Burkholderia pseudomultivorans]